VDRVFGEAVGSAFNVFASIYSFRDIVFLVKFDVQTPDTSILYLFLKTNSQMHYENIV
jgi:hypothetical protein